MREPATPSTDATPLGAWWSDVEQRMDAAASRRVDVYVRSLLPPHGARGCQRRVFDRLDALTQQSLLDDVSVHVIGERICLCDTCASTDAGANIVERIRELDGWGEEYGASTSRFFETRRFSSSITGEETHALVPPQVAVALRADDRLCGVFPCEMGGETYCVDDFVSAMQRLAEADNGGLLAETRP